MIMASPSELSLECKPQSYSMLLKSLGDSTTHPPFDPLQQHKMEKYLSRLEDERLKIDAFKRELPLCMHLLSNAVEASRQQLQTYRLTSTNQGIKRPILEEFIPMKHSNSEGPPDQQRTPNNTSDKANWMTSAQLWSQADVGATTKQLESLPSKELEMGFSPKLSLLDENNNKRQRNNGGAFPPFTKERNNGVNGALPELTLASDGREMEDNKGSLMSESGLPSENSAKVSNGIVMIGKAIDGTQTNVNGTAGTTTTSSATTATQQHRKQRRCWSPDLHRRFVNALQMLGGSQVATPKQIRELMKVDGLTNDEVKSHLQKYRLHTRRPGPSPQGPGAPGPQLVVLGGIWVPQEYATGHHHGVPPATIYSSQLATQVGPHHCPPGMPQEFYPTLPQLHHQVHFYKASSQGQSSPESHGGRGARDRTESIEDWKSESSSGEESNERKKLASRREREEESNGNEIILTF